MRIQKTVIALALAGAAFGAQAHKPWVLPSSTFVENDREAWVTVDAAISEGLFDIDHVPLKLDGLTIIGPDGATLEPQNVANGKLRNSFDVKMAKNGTYKIALVNQNVFASYKVNGEMKRWRGLEASMAKEVPANAEDLKVTRTSSRIETFVTANEPSDAVLKPTGSGLELVPVTNPTELRAGEKATWRFLLDGKPAANLPFSLIPGGVRYRGTLNEVRFSTDAKGEITFTIPAAGMYVATASWPAPQAQGAQGGQAQPPARRVTYSGTVEVLPE
ncbi:DUF4198 domain-containing protein [Pseudoduganella sp. SL102]|uniref:ABC transporter permease n=1 Tax=Pseudoduganella albidiflava TaxID=321983 RepID=A0A411X7Q0_9BURK|nr:MULTISPECIES: DUF4198 domain-containing protein [Pseudoduganella]QBI04845.1 DUF4198 domain-containing protein [Pseudoduganella albidiflava]WBS05855.1 DUF4198 domain-containing protein [Pseudoduganella sp. SL102]GGY52952.1 ABC transporter permease [Pseudoduganella albidiflava]